MVSKKIALSTNNLTACNTSASFGAVTGGDTDVMWVGAVLTFSGVSSRRPGWQ